MLVTVQITLELLLTLSFHIVGLQESSNMKLLSSTVIRVNGYFLHLFTMRIKNNGNSLDQGIIFGAGYFIIKKNRYCRIGFSGRRNLWLEQ